MSAQSKRQLKEAIEAMREAGIPVRAARLSTDGSILLLTETPEGALASNDDENWVDFAGTPKVSGA